MSGQIDVAWLGWRTLPRDARKGQKMRFDISFAREPESASKPFCETSQ
jgi:hypothetical protein